MDGVAFDLVVELIEMLAGPTGHNEQSVVLGTSTASWGRYRRSGLVPRELAEDLYDRLARGLGPHKPTKSSFEWPLSYDERSDLARQYYKAG